MWKKTGAWFYKSLPNYKCTPQPLRSSMHELRSPPDPPSPLVRPKPHTIRVVDSSSEEDDVIDSGPRGRSQSNATKRTSPPLERLNSLRLHGSASGTTSNEDGFFLRKLSSTLSLFSRQQANIHNDQNASSSNDLSSTSHMKIHDDRRRSSRCNSESSSYSVSEASVAGETLLGPGQTYREPPLGWLEVRLVYNAVQKTLDCTLFRARDLPAIDIICLPDPYARLNIVSEWGQLKQEKWLQSKIVTKTRSPEFNETIRFGGVEADELQGGTLYVVLLDEDKFGSDFLGAGRVQLKVVSFFLTFFIKFATIFEFFPIFQATETQTTQNQRTSVPLGAQDEICLKASSAIFTRGSILIALCYNTKRRALVVQIKRCSNLISMDNNGYSDPFVKV